VYFCSTLSTFKKSGTKVKKYVFYPLLKKVEQKLKNMFLSTFKKSGTKVKKYVFIHFS
jgi:hypothetical protein